MLKGNILNYWIIDTVGNLSNKRKLSVVILGVVVGKEVYRQNKSNDYLDSQKYIFYVFLAFSAQSVTRYSCKNLNTECSQFISHSAFDFIQCKAALLKIACHPQ